MYKLTINIGVTAGGPYNYQATTGSYDGAPDASRRDRAIGFGMTLKEAADDLLEQLEEIDEEEAS